MKALTVLLAGALITMLCALAGAPFLVWLIVLVGVAFLLTPPKTP